MVIKETSKLYKYIESNRDAVEDCHIFYMEILTTFMVKASS